MMKRISIACIAVVFCLLTSTLCFAADSEVGGESIGVYARYLKTMDAYTAPVEDGETTVTVEDGTSVTVSGITESGLWLVVYPIPERDAEARRWFESCLASQGTDFYPMEIYFVDQDGSRVEVREKFLISVEMPVDYTDPGVRRLFTDGRTAELSRRVNGRKILFEASGSGYYVLMEKRTPDPSDEEDEEQDETAPAENGAQTSAPVKAAQNEVSGAVSDEPEKNPLTGAGTTL